METLVQRGSYLFGEFQLNLDMRVLTRSGNRVPLGSKAYEVLICLVARAGEVVSKSDLLKEVWAGSFVEEATLSQHIFSLRKALADCADYIVTVPGRGYRFMGDVRHIPPDAYPGQNILHELRERTHMVIEEPLLPAVAPANPASIRTTLYVLSAVTVVALSAFAAWWWAHRPQPPDHLGVVLADFINTTGDPTFDRTLKRALEIDLEQSPFMEMLTEGDTTDTLQRMGRTSDTPITGGVAREICERNNREALITGSISSVGDDYFLTLEATACSTGKRITSAKAEASNKTSVLATLDSLAERVRSKLGESARSIQGYDVPIEYTATSSLEALKVYSLGMYLQDQGKPFADSLSLFQRAVEIDPNFAFAYGEISSMYYNMGEPNKAAEYLQKCYDLRSRMNARDRLLIEAHYAAGVLKDWTVAIKAYEAWAATYPDDWVPWVDAANLYTQRGEFAPAIADAQRALQINHNPVNYDVLGRAYKDTGRFADAKTLVQQAAQEGKDTSTLHTFLLEIAVDEGDTIAFDREDKWLASHKDSLHDYYAGEAAAEHGRYQQAEDLFRHEVSTDRQEGLNELADAVAIEQAEMEREVGMTATAHAILDHLGKQIQGDTDFALQQALLGNTTFAEHYLAAHANDAHPDSSVIHREVPEMRAALASHRGAWKDAVADLTPPNTQEWGHVSIFSQRGQAELQSGQPDLAAKDYQFVLSHPGSFFAVDTPLAHLGLARAYAAQKNLPAARSEYEAFLAAWKDADPGLPVLRAAKSELATLR